MSSEPSYRTLADRDYEFAMKTKYLGSNSHYVRLIEQYVEKILKHLIDQSGHPEDKQLLNSHNVPMLAKRADQLYDLQFTTEDKQYFRSLKSYYYDTNYPGEQYTEIDDDETEALHSWVQQFREKLRSRVH